MFIFICVAISTYLTFHVSDGFIPPVNVMRNAHSLSVPVKKRKQMKTLVSF